MNTFHLPDTISNCFPIAKSLTEENQQNELLFISTIYQSLLKLILQIHKLVVHVSHNVATDNDLT